MVLQKGHVLPDQPTLVRMHQLSLMDDIYGAQGKRNDLLARSMELIGHEGSGLVVLLTGSDEGDFLSKSILRYAAKGALPSDMDELRNYGVGAQLLAELGVHDMVLLTNSQHSLVALDGYDLAVVGQRPIEL